jgi:hypothetical protein
MSHEDPPQDVRDLAEARAIARRARDWATADDLRTRIEAAGWKVVDAATLYTLERAAPPDERSGGVPRYGASASVPSRLDDTPTGVASVVLVATDWPHDLARALRALVDHAPDGTQLIVVANEPSSEQAAALDGLDATDPGAPGVAPELVWTSARLGHATALNAGVRRAVAPVVVLLDTSVEPGGDLVSALVAALADPTVAVVGPFARVERPAVRGAAQGHRRRGRDRGLRAGLPPRGLRRPRAPGRALRLLPQPRHLVEPRAARPAGARAR